MDDRAARTLMKPNIYLKRYAYPETHIDEPPDAALGLVIVIPSYNEPDLLTTLEDLYQCHLPECSVEVIIVINNEAGADEAIVQSNLSCKNSVELWSSSQQNKHLKLHLIYKPALPAKHAGVGLARKIGMDEAVRRFEAKGINGIIACLDADCRVDKNYMQAIYHHWQQYPECNGVSIYYEHPIDELSHEEKKGIVDYELHLRYYVHAQKYACFPFAFQTVGSCMAVSSKAYQKQGGMNRRKAGEDFWFLQKIFRLGNFHNLNTTRVRPSPRSSYRVPFGTGRFMSQYISGESKPTTTYHFSTFVHLRALLQKVDSLFQSSSNHVIDDLPDTVKTFLDYTDFYEKLSKIRQNAASKASFRKGFHQWFDGFMLMKFVHYFRDHFFPNAPLERQVDTLIKTHFAENPVFKDNYDRLVYLRRRERQL